MIPMKFHSLWAINAPLDQDRLCRQLDHMRDDGLDGVVFHPRFYPNQPAYLSDDYLRIVSRVILHAQEIGMTFWIYDENGWPSGIAGGELLRRHPDDAGGFLSVHEGSDARAWHGFEAGGMTRHFVLHRTREIDYLNPSACGHFLSITHARYRDGLDPAAWAYVEAFFTDEPEYGLGVNIDRIPPGGAVPWSPGMEADYRERTGHDFRAELPHVFFNDPDGAHEEVRIRFWEYMTDRLCTGFFAPYHAWCRNEGKLFTGHLKGDEHPLFQVMMNGSAHQVFRHLDMPGIDPLERFPACDYYAREVASAARQFGTGRTMAEVMGGGGWGSTPEDLERFLLWLANHGSTDLVIHLHQSRLDSHAIRDWPPSNPKGLNWREAYSDVLQSVRRRTDAAAVDAADTLVLAPYRGIMAAYEPWSLMQSNIHNCATYPDTPAGRLNRAFLGRSDRFMTEIPRHHYADERSLEEHGRVEAGRLWIGRHGYTTVIVDNGCRFREAGRGLLEGFTAAGGRILAGEEARRSNGGVVAALGGEDGDHAEEISVSWDTATAPENALLLVCVRDADGGRWRAAFHVGADLAVPLGLAFADELADCEVDGQPVKWETGEEGSRVRLPIPSGKSGLHSLSFSIKEQDEGPLFVWLRGDFRVESASPWGPGPNGARVTEGPWRVFPAAPPPPGGEMTEAGWPMAEGLFDVTGRFVAGRAWPAGSRLALGEIKADAARIQLDGVELGWVWGPDWSAELPNGLAAGSHELSVEIAPSTYNRFGPHHHIDGDRPIVSPWQFTGQKNFADRDDAPAITHDQRWRVKPLSPPRTVSLST